MFARLRRTPWIIRLILLIVMVVITIAILGVNSRKVKEEILRDEKITVELINSVDPEQLTFENEMVKVTVGCDQYLTYLDMIISDESYSEDFRTDYKKIKRSIETTSSCLDQGIALDEYVVAGILEHGLASVYDKRTQAEIPTVRIWYYESTCGPLCGGGGRTFYLPDGSEFLHVQDWIA
jgi:hypothetical protein